MLTTRSARPIRRHPARAPAESSGQGVRQAKSRCTNRALLQHVGLVLHAAVVGCCDIAVEAEAARPRRRVVRGSRLPARTSGAPGSDSMVAQSTAQLALMAAIRPLQFWTQGVSISQSLLASSDVFRVSAL